VNNIETWIRLLQIPSNLSYPIPALWGGAILLGFSIGILTGLFGVGGGFLVVPLLNVLLGVPYRIAVGTSLGVVLAASCAGLLKKLLDAQPKVSIPLTLLLLVGSVIGVRVGMRIFRRIESAKIRQYFVIVILLAMGIVAWDLLRK